MDMLWNGKKIWVSSSQSLHGPRWGYLKPMRKSFCMLPSLTSSSQKWEQTTRFITACKIDS
ncbi:uncharacterized protein BO72DRAFT_237678 [Aspergillus fijiensis CBS 313.89]|uniref:Uncharacterized protein n=1 Tax=Aspergillus fijiensis CBS 313.89 TaxID=1448319 RepID=A0A8G1W222_9EURO|nr:uncharacterized protein BO72DRAFT_237678 [Aspergillus fijiensis CBS 313.89]RAK81062.1 hypothetical protein BO72DRAFT_237678 [Aspergillus fijiensis CBS 313.89]